MTLTREQILELGKDAREAFGTAYGDYRLEMSEFERLANGIDDICQMALNSIPRPFNPEDKGTWPEKEGKYLTWIRFGHTEFNIWDGERWWIGTKNGKQIHHPDYVKFYQPIPAVPSEASGEGREVEG